MARPQRPIGELMQCGPAGGLPPNCPPAAGGPCATCATDLAPAIAENASSALEVSSPAGSQKSHPLESQIAADQYLASRAAARKGRSGLRIMRREGNPSG